MIIQFFKNIWKWIWSFHKPTLYEQDNHPIILIIPPIPPPTCTYNQFLNIPIPTNIEKNKWYNFQDGLGLVPLINIPMVKVG